MQPLPFRTLDDEYRGRFGEKVIRCSVDGRMGCPNRDGTVGRGGCIFCSPADIVPFTLKDGVAEPADDAEWVKVQLDAGIAHLRQRYNARKFIAYFNRNTSTYAPADKLRRIYEAALAHEDIVGLTISTRPDCLPSATMKLLAEIAAKHYLWVELGLQSASEKTLKRINRGHGARIYREAVLALKRSGIKTAAHVVLGLPGEGPEDFAGTARFLAGIPVDGVKLHNAYVSSGTALETAYRRGEYRPMGLDEYAAAAADFVALLPRNTVIIRVTADAPARYVVAPEWARKKHEPRIAVERAIAAKLSANRPPDAKP